MSQFTCNIVVLGSKCSGKTSLISRCLFRPFTDTYMATMVTEPIEVKYKECSYLWWDTTTQPGMSKHNEYPIRHANKILVCYNGQDESSYTEAISIFESIECDQKWYVCTHKDCGGFARDSSHFSVSSKTGEGILEIMSRLYDGSAINLGLEWFPSCW